MLTQYSICQFSKSIVDFSRRLRDTSIFSMIKMSCCVQSNMVTVRTTEVKAERAQFNMDSVYARQYVSEVHATILKVFQRYKTITWKRRGI